MSEAASLTNPTPSSYSARVDTSGRIVIPIDLRERLHVHSGDELVLQEVAGTICIKSYEQVLADAQAFFREIIPANVSLVDELLAERREEARREAAEEAKMCD